jgi:hypothetical protein
MDALARQQAYRMGRLAKQRLRVPARTVATGSQARNGKAEQVTAKSSFDRCLKVSLHGRTSCSPLHPKRDTSSMQTQETRRQQLSALVNIAPER